MKFDLESLKHTIEEYRKLSYSEFTVSQLDKMMNEGAKIEELVLLINADDFQASPKVTTIPTKYGLLETIISNHLKPGTLFLFRRSQIDFMEKTFKELDELPDHYKELAQLKAIGRL